MKKRFLTTMLAGVMTFSMMSPMTAFAKTEDLNVYDDEYGIEEVYAANLLVANPFDVNAKTIGGQAEPDAFSATITYNDFDFVYNLDTMRWEEEEKEFTITNTSTLSQETIDALRQLVEEGTDYEYGYYGLAVLLGQYPNPYVELKDEEGNAFSTLIGFPDQYGIGYTNSNVDEVFAPDATFTFKLSVKNGISQEDLSKLTEENTKIDILRIYFGLIS